MKNPDFQEPRGPDDTGESEEVDLNDADVSANVDADVSAPPPLPPTAEATHSPSYAPPPYARPSYPPPSHTSPSYGPPPWAPANAPRRPSFIAGLVVIVLVVGLAGGGAVAVYLRRGKASPGPGGSQTSSVITIPTVDMNDAPDGGP
jgi:hypothetical protein